MLWLYNNIGTVVVCALLAAVLGFIIAYLIRSKKSGKSSCGSNCVGCALNGSCHHDK